MSKLIFIEADGDERNTNIDQTLVFVPDGATEEQILGDETIKGLYENPTIVSVLEHVELPEGGSHWRTYTG